MIGLEDKKYPSVTVQGVVLGTNVLYLQHSVPNFFIFVSMALIFTLFTLQAVNHRFFYYFPVNRFAEKMTYDVDTFILYGITALAIFFMIAGIFSVSHAIIGTIVVALSPFAWRQYGYPWVRGRITKRLKKETYTFWHICPCCGGPYVIKRKVLTWNTGIEYQKCLGECGKEKAEVKLLNMG
ncbi:MAG: hypothetical protein SWQ30_18735 [Thermodesulfobacteriota bacterium]|nr:hypothetical protein [Thermodesulfobacteriota bacterium]